MDCRPIRFMQLPMPALSTHTRSTSAATSVPTYVNSGTQSKRGIEFGLHTASDSVSTSDSTYAQTFPYLESIFRACWQSNLWAICEVSRLFGRDIAVKGINLVVFSVTSEKANCTDDKEKLCEEQSLNEVKVQENTISLTWMAT
jgi:hypothetical protein